MPAANMEELMYDALATDASSANELTKKVCVIGPDCLSLSCHVHGKNEDELAQAIEAAAHKLFLIVYHHPVTEMRTISETSDEVLFDAVHISTTNPRHHHRHAPTPPEQAEPTTEPSPMPETSSAVYDETSDSEELADTLPLLALTDPLHTLVPANGDPRLRQILVAFDEENQHRASQGITRIGQLDPRDVERFEIVPSITLVACWLIQTGDKAYPSVCKKVTNVNPEERTLTLRNDTTKTKARIPFTHITAIGLKDHKLIIQCMSDVQN